jgi:hypothetical protein
VSKDTTVRKLKRIIGFKQADVGETLMDVATGPIGASRFMTDIAGFPKLTEISEKIKEIGESNEPINSRSNG